MKKLTWVLVSDLPTKAEESFCVTKQSLFSICRQVPGIERGPVDQRNDWFSRRWSGAQPRLRRHPPFEIPAEHGVVGVGGLHRVAGLRQLHPQRRVLHQNLQV